MVQNSKFLKNILSPLLQKNTKPKSLEECPEYQTILENIKEGIIVTDKDGEIIIMNKRAEAMLALRIQDALGKKLGENILIEKEKGYYISLEKLLAKLEYLPGKKFNATVHVIEKNKTKLPALAKITPIFLNGQRKGTVLLLPDVPRRDEIEKVNVEFLSAAAHQLRTPLGSMRWAIEVLLNGDVGKLPKTALDILDQIYKSNHWMINIVNDLLNVSRIDQGRAENTPQLINYVEILKTVISETKLESKKKSVTIDLDIDKIINPTVMLDPRRFRDIIQNLLVNAIKYSFPKSTVKIKVDQQDKQLQIAISDTGIGIPAKDQGMIFSRFFRADNALKTKAEGTGLGLFMVKSYVESSGGNIWFESKEGQGTTFYLDFPIAER